MLRPYPALGLYALAVSDLALALIYWGQGALRGSSMLTSLIRCPYGDIGDASILIGPCSACGQTA